MAAARLVGGFAHGIAMLSVRDHERQACTLAALPIASAGTAAQGEGAMQSSTERAASRPLLTSTTSAAPPAHIL
eukprot:scaffold284656_cov28-Tisochrysis_lutea.AAC.6